MRIGVALLDNTAGGTAQIGVLKILTNQGVKIDTVSGFGSGAVIAALYGAGYEPGEIESVYLSHFNSGRNLLFRLFTKLKKNSLDSAVNKQFIDKIMPMFAKKNIFELKDFKKTVFLITEDTAAKNRIIFSSRKNMFIKGNGIIEKTDVSVKEALYSCVENNNLGVNFAENGDLPLIFPLNCIGLDSFLAAKSAKDGKHKSLGDYVLPLESDSGAKVRDNILAGEKAVNNSLEDILVSLYLKKS